MEALIGILFWGLIIYYFVKRSKRKKREKLMLMEAIERDRIAQEKLSNHRKDSFDQTQDRVNSRSFRDYEEDDVFDIFNDPRIETEAKNNRNNPIIITFIYEKHDEDGNVIGTQERAIQPYYKDDEYLEGYCLDREERRTFRIDKIARFTGNSETIFDELD